MQLLGAVFLCLGKRVKTVIVSLFDYFALFELIKLSKYAFICPPTGILPSGIASVPVQIASIITVFSNE
jgi:hypothetical protein